MKKFFQHRLFLVVLVGLSGSALAGNISPNYNWNKFPCSGQAVYFEDLSTTSSGTINSWLWQFGDPANTTSAVQDPTFIFPGSGAFDVTLIVGDDEGGSDTLTRQVVVLDKPQAIMDAEVNCFPGEITVTNTSTFRNGTITDFIWTIDGTQNKTSQVSFTPTNTGSYPIQLVVFGDNGCNDTLNDVVTSLNPPTVTNQPSGDIRICPGDFLDIRVLGNASRYAWRSGEDGDSIRVDNTGTYISFGYLTDDCFSSDTTNLTIETGAFVDAGPDKEVYQGDSVQLDGNTNVTNFVWQPATGLSDTSSLSPSASPFVDIQYILLGRTDLGCKVSDTVLVTVLDPADVPIRNVITPNGDGRNDFWNLEDVPGIARANVIVINRYGIEVLNEEPYNNKWDGSFEGNPLPEGTYIYLIVFPESFNRAVVRGTLEIIR